MIGYWRRLTPDEKTIWQIVFSYIFWTWPAIPWESTWTGPYSIIDTAGLMLLAGATTTVVCGSLFLLAWAGILTFSDHKRLVMQRQLPPSGKKKQIVEAQNKIARLEKELGIG